MNFYGPCGVCGDECVGMGKCAACGDSLHFLCAESTDDGTVLCDKCFEKLPEKGVCCTCQGEAPLEVRQSLAGYKTSVMAAHDFFGGACQGEGTIPQFVIRE